MAWFKIFPLIKPINTSAPFMASSNVLDLSIIGSKERFVLIKICTYLSLLNYAAFTIEHYNISFSHQQRCFLHRSKGSTCTVNFTNFTFSIFFRQFQQHLLILAADDRQSMLDHRALKEYLNTLPGVQFQKKHLELLCSPNSIPPKLSNIFTVFATNSSIFFVSTQYQKHHVGKILKANPYLPHYFLIFEAESNITQAKYGGMFEITVLFNFAVYESIPRIFSISRQGSAHPVAAGVKSRWVLRFVW